MGTASMGSDDPEMGNAVAGGFMGDFFGQVAEIKKTMEAIKQNVADLGSKQAKALTDVYGGGDYKMEIENLTDVTNGMASRVRTHLTGLDAELKTMLQRDPSCDQNSDYKIRRNMHATLTKKFMDVMQTYQDCQSQYKSKCQDTVKRQFKIVKPDATEEEVSQVVEGGGDQIFTEQMMGSRNAQARAALEDVQEKHKDIQRLEQSISELHQLFVDLSVLVESQGELLDVIEYSVSQSLSYTKKGVTELEAANTYARKSRKKMCYIMIFLICVALFVVGPMLF